MTKLIPHVGIFITHEELTGVRSSMSDAIHLLSRLNIHHVLRMIATLNATFVNSFESSSKLRSLQNVLVENLFTEQLKVALRSSNYAGDQSVVVFHRQQQLIILRLALMSCPSETGQLWDAEAAHLFGEACLMVNDFAGHFEGERPDGDTLLDLATILLPIGELPSDSQTAGLVGRSREIWLQIPNDQALQAEKDYVPTSARFQEHYSISLEHFVHGLFLILLNTESFNPHTSKPLESLVFSSKRYLDKVSFSKDEFQRILRIVSCKLSTLKDKVVTEPIQNYRFDFTLLRRYPLVEVEPDVYVCLDVGFLRKYFTDGIYWLIHDVLSEDEQRNFRSFFGKVFATYVEKILDDVYKVGPMSSTHMVKANPVFAESRGEVCDYLITNGDAWIIIESKAALLTTRAKYSGMSLVLEKELQAKFVQGEQDKNKRKGVSQLSQSIKKLTDGVDISSQSIRFDQCRKVYPVLISYDSALVSPGIPQYLESQFNSRLGEMPSVPAIMSLTVLSVNDVEVLTALKNKHELSTVLATYHYYRGPSEALAGFINRYRHYKVDLTLTRFYKSFVALTEDLKPCFK